MLAEGLLGWVLWLFSPPFDLAMSLRKDEGEWIIFQKKVSGGCEGSYLKISQDPHSCERVSMELLSTHTYTLQTASTDSRSLSDDGSKEKWDPQPTNFFDKFHHHSPESSKYRGMTSQSENCTSKPESLFFLWRSIRLLSRHQFLDIWPAQIPADEGTKNLRLIREKAKKKKALLVVFSTCDVRRFFI